MIQHVLRTPVTAIALLLTACATWAPPDGVTFTVDCPERVRRGEHLVFRVDVLSTDGSLRAGDKYGYLVDWVGLKGMVHTGRSGVEEKIAVKGSPGTATLRIYARGANRNRVQVAQRTFEVE